ncbi:putative HECT-type ubiquitin ligase-interacting protein creD [Fulvia fulva]|uniref:HECT-type ubiquitin ligase-interacting protein creD n=1 Tax=Passalora fulva TaxID=5499 RepID=A0A9Q8L7M4_PASFU|nr:putative HECT-type ubiquitin ligase-interacting protein creD [Fulvia fulva]KAK4635143.1 putative HECT-type ubiquitin ligase-interacting protein creD [Fulvia fulva]KAK4637638.1 putative HECT-type ubiquitin ligase-interacting protein creD [Fulvia fulva]UJO11693.1 putative HECT-type ubiquitin ligase-interacting protein creD [Fulvia fulva]WPV10170.1 putative HECT-type ubiquitin ligase-interacting protein creD [Fulvia fulva]WPV24201.1 putative HECT-type ubiquitin ligase-interacting protein creD 
MVPTPRTYAHGLRHQKPSLEIVPDDRFIVFHGTEHEAQTVKLTGRVRLHCPEAMSILKPKVRLEGKRKISWWYMGGMSAGEVTDKRLFWNQEQRLGIESAHKVKAGTIEWPFEFELDPSMPESVEGLRETYIAYHIHASVSRPGWNAKDLMAQEHIRIVRTLGQDSMEMTRSRVNADIWANKISYSISIPTDAVVFGTSITADVELSPIKKGLRLGKIELRLTETVVKRIQVAEVPDIRGDRSKTEETEVAKTDMEFSEQSRITYEEETTEDPMMADEMYKFKATLPLPKSLNICRQDVDSHSINITHRFKLMVNIHNPEGHISQLVCRLPVKLFISPNLPVDESNEVTGTINGVSDEQLNSSETAVVAPPEYGRHQLDQIYSGIDPSGFMSRAGSGPGTPAGLMAQSRRGSHENVLSMNGIANDDPSAHHGSAMPHLLHSRLANLQDMNGSSNSASTSNGVSRNHSPSGGSTPANGLSGSANGHSPEHSIHQASGSATRSAGSYFPVGSPSASYGHSPNASAPMSRRTSDEVHPEIVHTQDYNMDDLVRVPSYGAALRTPGAVTPFTEVPPSYEFATSRPPSPGSLSPVIQRPGQAPVRTANGTGASTPTGHSSQQTLTTPMAALNLNNNVSNGNSAQRAPESAHSAHDDDSRLRMLRARS